MLFTWKRNTKSILYLYIKTPGKTWPPKYLVSKEHEWYERWTRYELDSLVARTEQASNSGNQILFQAWHIKGKRGSERMVWKCHLQAESAGLSQRISTPASERLEEVKLAVMCDYLIHRPLTPLKYWALPRASRRCVKFCYLLHSVVSYGPGTVRRCYILENRWPFLIIFWSRALSYWE